MICIGRDQYTYSSKDAGQHLVFPQCGQYTEIYITALSLAGLRCTVRNTGPIKSACSISLPESFLFFFSTVETSYVAPNIWEPVRIYPREGS